MRHFAGCLAALALLAARPAASQFHAPEEGSRVRVSPAASVSQERWIVGTVLASGPDSLTLLRADTNQPFSLHRGEIDAVHVSTGHRPTGPAVARSAVIGAVVGAAAGALLGTVAYRDDPDDWDVFSRRELALVGAAYGGGAGTLVGGLLGWRSAGEQWAELPLRSAPVVAVRTDGVVGVSLSLQL